MKTKAIFAALTMLALLAGSAYASSGNTGWGHIDRAVGTVAGYDGADSVTFEATCDTVETLIYHYTLNAAGKYRVYFDCDAEQVACITARDGERVAHGCGEMSFQGEHDSVDIDLVFDEELIPEFGLIAIPLLLSMAGFVFMRGKM
ncbi:MAG: hypothetical protein U9Q92_00810 [archaeon]|nr:hypothetical protein [archaeon]